MDHGERLIAKALKGRRDGVIVATKGGHPRDGQAWPVDGRPEHIRAACEASLRALETDRIDLYQFHRPDPHVPYAESIGAFHELQDEGKVRWVGISNASVDQIEEALGIVDVVAVQNQLALDFTSPVSKGEVAALHGARDRLPALVAARRHRQGGRRRGARPGDRRGRGARRLAPAGRARLAARARPDRDPDPGLLAAGDDQRLRARRRARSSPTTRSARSPAPWGSPDPPALHDRLPAAARGGCGGGGRGGRRPPPAPARLPGAVRRSRALRGRGAGRAALPGARRSWPRCSRARPAARRCGWPTSAPATASPGRRCARTGSIRSWRSTCCPRPAPRRCATALGSTATTWPPTRPRSARPRRRGCARCAPQALAVVGALGGSHVPRAAVEALLALLEPPGLLAYCLRRRARRPARRSGAELARERYVHRRTAAGGERIWEAVVRGRRGGPARRRAEPDHRLPGVRRAMQPGVADRRAHTRAGRATAVAAPACARRRG